MPYKNAGILQFILPLHSLYAHLHHGNCEQGSHYSTIAFAESQNVLAGDNLSLTAQSCQMHVVIQYGALICILGLEIHTGSPPYYSLTKDVGKS